MKCSFPLIAGSDPRPASQLPGNSGNISNTTKKTITWRASGTTSFSKLSIIEALQNLLGESEHVLDELVNLLSLRLGANDYQKIIPAAYEPRNAVYWQPLDLARTVKRAILLSKNMRIAFFW